MEIICLEGARLRQTYQVLSLISGLAVLTSGFAGLHFNPAIAQTTRPRVQSGTGAVTIRSDTQEANSKTGVITARGNVQVFYPARQMQGTSAQAQYFSRERRIIMTGNVYILQAGNSLRGESVTYLMDEGRFMATPRPATQVESIYIVQDSPSTPAPKPTTSPAPLRPLALPGISAPPPLISPPASGAPTSVSPPSLTAPRVFTSPPAALPTPNFANP
jgi:lipopolysaccharide export system protein LptA